MTHLLAGTASPEKLKRLQKIGLDVGCYVCGAKPTAVHVNRALDGRIYFACPECRDRTV